MAELTLSGKDDDFSQLITSGTGAANDGFAGDLLPMVPALPGPSSRAGPLGQSPGTPGQSPCTPRRAGPPGQSPGTPRRTLTDSSGSSGGSSSSGGSHGTLGLISSEIKLGADPGRITLTPTLGRALTRQKSEIDYNYRPTPVWLEETMPVESTEQGPAPTITLQDIGIIPDQQLDENRYGKVRSLGSLTCMEYVFMFITTVSVLVIMGGGIWWLETFSKPSFTYITVALVHAAFSIYHVIHGIRTSRPLDMLCLVVSIIILIVYITVLAADIGITQTAVLICLLYTWVVGPIMIILACYYGKEYYDSRHLVFRTIGANLDFQDAVFTAFSAIALIAFDLQLSLSTLMLLVRKDMGIPLIMAVLGGVLVTLLVSVLFYFTVKSEEKQLFFISMIASLLQPAYVIFQLYETAYYHEVFSLSVVTIVCCVVAICVRMLLLITLYKVYKNFGKGVKQRIFPPKETGKDGFQFDWKISYNTFTGR